MKVDGMGGVTTKYHRIAPEAGLATDENGNPDACFLKIDGGSALDMAAAFKHLNIRPSWATEISEEEYLEATGDSHV
ncbi:MAG: hypothetical protein ACPLRM_03945 [Anaerolineae bacterium]